MKLCITTQMLQKASPVDQLLNTRPSITTLASLLKHCSQTQALQEGKLLHAHITKLNYGWNTFLGNWLIKMYGDCGSMADAHAVFHSLQNPNVYSWNILITAYVKNCLYEDALEIYEKMLVSEIKPDNVTFVCALDACSNKGCLLTGQRVHAAVASAGFEGHASVGISLVNMYGKCGSVENAKAVFGRLPHRDVVSWSAMIAAFAQNGHGKEAIDSFYAMRKGGIRPDEISFLCVLDACATVALLEIGQEIHAAIVGSGFGGKLAIGTALINMYGKCKSVGHARSVFTNMPRRNLIAWNSMITACSQNGHGKEALDLFYKMQGEGFRPDQVTYVCALDACASLAAWKKGREIHAAVLRAGHIRHVVGNALINMYGKCGDIDSATNVFGQMPHRDVISWNAIISACAQNGHDKAALELYNQMKRTGCRPDHITFLGILSACSHTGHVDDARDYFKSMCRDYGLVQKVEHYVCLVDLLCRSGHLDDAEDLINRMPFERESKVWMSLLVACKSHGDVERGVRAASRVFKLDPNNAAPYLLLSDIYVAAGKWKEAQDVVF